MNVHIHTKINLKFDSIKENRLEVVSFILEKGDMVSSEFTFVVHVWTKWDGP